MYKHILVTTDGSTLSLKAVRTAVNLAAALGGAPVGTVRDAGIRPAGLRRSGDVHPGNVAKRFKEAVEKDAKAALAVAARAADEADLSFTSVRATDPQPWRAIIRTARAKKCDLIVMASHGRRGLSGLLLGSETTKVLTHSKVPVLVVR